MWNAYEHDRRIPITISVEYDESSDLYIVDVKRGTDSDFKTFTPQHVPLDGLMNITDMEKSIQLANVLLKELKKEAKRGKK